MIYADLIIPVSYTHLLFAKSIVIMRVVCCTLLYILFFGGALVAQPGLDSVIIETYYISDSNDEGTSFFPVPAGAVTYRIYVDMAPDWGLQAIYGATNSSTAEVDTFIIRSTQPFFNNCLLYTSRCV